MSGTGRPTYRTRKAKGNPSAAYTNTQHVMVRDLPGHLKIKLRQKKIIDRDELLKRLETLDKSKNVPTNKDTVDSSDSESETETSTVTSDTDDADDEQTALMNELARIKKERQEEEERKIREAQEQIRNQFTANPLMDPDYSTKKKWTEESIFQNQAVNIPKRKDQHANDPIRNEYHYLFLRKYLKI